MTDTLTSIAKLAPFDATTPPDTSSVKKTGPSFGDVLLSQGEEAKKSVQAMESGLNLAAQGQMEPEDLAAIVKEAEIVLAEVNALRTKVTEGLTELLKSPV